MVEFFHLQIKQKVKYLVVHFQKVFMEKFQKDIFLTTVQLQMHLLRMCKTRGAIFKLVCHDQSISASQKTLLKTKQKLDFNALAFISAFQLLGFVTLDSSQACKIHYFGGKTKIEI